MECGVRKLVITLLVATMILGTLLAPTQAKKPKKKKSPVTFEAEGSVAIANPADLTGVGITRAEFESGCSVPTFTQGVDGYVIELPPKVTSVSTRVFVTGTSPSGVGLLDMFFFDEACRDMGQILGSDDFDPIMSMGTKFVLVTNWLGDPTDFTFNATEVR